jgi:hypothetical protein
VKRRRVGDRAAEQPHHAEEQVRLLLARRERVEQRENLGVAGDRARQALVHHRPAVRCMRGELDVPRSDRHTPSSP